MHVGLKLLRSCQFGHYDRQCNDCQCSGYKPQCYDCQWYKTKSFAGNTVRTIGARPQKGETSKGVAEKIEAASASPFEERICVAIFMAPLFRRQTHEMNILGPEGMLVQQHSVTR